MKQYGELIPINERFKAAMDFQYQRMDARDTIDTLFASERNRLSGEVGTADEQYLRRMTEDAWSGVDPMARYLMFPNMNAQTVEEAQARARAAERQRQQIQMGMQFQAGSITRQFGLQRQLRSIGGNDSPGQDYSDAIAQAQALYALRQRDIAMEDDADKRAMDAQRARYEFIQAQDEARIQREEQIAQIAQQQAKETASFLTGIVNASLSRDRHALPNYFSAFGRQTLDKIVGNFGEDFIGPLQNYVGLGRTGLLGDPDNPSVLGRLVKGSPLGFSANDYRRAQAAVSSSTAGISDYSRNASSTDVNTGATNLNTDALNRLTGAITTGGGGGTVRVAGGGGGFSLPGGLLGGRSFSMPSFHVGGGTAGNSGGGYSLSMSMPQVFSGGSNAYSDLGMGSNLPIAMPSWSLPNLGSFSSGGGMGSFPIAGAGFSLPNLGGSSSAPNLTASDAAALGMTLPAAAYSPAGNAKTMGTSIPSVYSSPTTDLSNINNFARSLSKTGTGFGTNFGYGLQDAMSGYGLPNLFNGVEAGPGEMAGDIVGMGGAVAGGTLQAIKGFSQGGARGDLSGIAGVATAAAPFTGPAAPFIEAGASLLDLVGALFPDPRQARIKQETVTSLQNAYVSPSPHDYSFGSTGGGVTFSQGGGVSAGGPITVNHTWNLSALNANDLYDMFKGNPEQLSQLVETGITQGGNASLSQILSYVAQYGSI